MSHHPIFLVSLPKESDGRLARALGVPCVSLIGLMDGILGADALIQALEQEVAEVRLTWFDQSSQGVYLPVKIRSVTSKPLGG